MGVKFLIIPRLKWSFPVFILFIGNAFFPKKIQISYHGAMAKTSLKEMSRNKNKIFCDKLLHVFILFFIHILQTEILYIAFTKYAFTK